MNGRFIFNAAIFTTENLPSLFVHAFACHITALLSVHLCPFLPLVSMFLAVGCWCVGFYCLWYGDHQGG